MTFEVLHRRDLNVDKWNRRVIEQQSEIYSHTSFLDLCTDADWKAIIWGDYNRVLPIYRKRKWGIIPYVCMPPFCQKWDARYLSNNDIQRVLEYLRRRNVRVDIRIITSKNSTIVGQTKENFILEKGKRTYEELFGDYSSLLKKNLMRAKGEIIENENPSEVKAFLSNNEMYINYVKEDSRPILEKILSGKCLESKILSLRFEGSIEAVLIVPVWNQVGYTIFPYTSAKGRAIQAMSMLMDHLVKDDTLLSINFEGSSIPSIANFYKQFNARSEQYLELN